MNFSMIVDDKTEIIFYSNNSRKNTMQCKKTSTFDLFMARHFLLRMEEL